MGSAMNKNSDMKNVSHKDFAELWHPSLFFLKIKRKIERFLNKTFQRSLALPIQAKIVSHWANDDVFSNYIEKIGLPRQGVESSFSNKLQFKVDPKKLDRLVSQHNSITKRRLTNFFIWDSDWDKKYTDFKLTGRYVFISDIWNNRDDLTKSDTYKKYLELLNKGTPYRCINKNHNGVLLDSEKKILRYLKIYLSFMYSMKEKGYDSTVTSDPVGVAICRDGRLVKINKGLHRLAMAQVLDMDYIEVTIRAVHREWWEKSTQMAANTDEKFSKITEELRSKNLLF